MENTNELQALQNAINSIDIKGLKIQTWNQNDKRKTKPVYLLSVNGNCFSPKLSYNEMNYFILGMIKLYTFQ